MWCASLYWPVSNAILNRIWYVGSAAVEASSSITKIYNIGEIILYFLLVFPVKRKKKRLFIKDKEIYITNIYFLELCIYTRYSYLQFPLTETSFEFIAVKKQ